jgi:hypothetical protein
MSTQLACIRFRDDAKADAGQDAGIAVDAEPEASTPIEGGDAVANPPPVCDRFTPNIAESIAGDLISALGGDCRLRLHFANMPPIAVTHLQECLTAQIGQVLGCRHPNGDPFKYPTEDSKGQFCRDMKSSHMALSLSDGDFDAFIGDIGVALAQNGLNADEQMRVLAVFGATRNDIVRIKDAGPTKPCDAPDAN